MKGKIRKMLMPRNMWALKTQPASASSSGAPARKVTMRCAHSASFIIMPPSRCWADSGMVARPSANCSHSRTSSTMSLVLELTRMRTSERRRCSRMLTPMKPSKPNRPPEIMAMSCLAPAAMKGSYTKCGVSMPTLWPKNRNRMPTWNRLLPQRSCPARSSCEESLFQVYWSRSKRIRLPSRNTVRAM
ncbi:hypothetical protein D9M68_836970 [compost metagenome]